MNKITVCVTGPGMLPAEALGELPKVLEEMADAMQNVAQSIVLCTCVAYLCIHHREEIETAVLESVMVDMGNGLSAALRTLIRDIRATGEIGPAGAVSFDAEMRTFMFTVRSATERYINEHGLEVKTGIG